MVVALAGWFLCWRHVLRGNILALTGATAMGISGGAIRRHIRAGVWRRHISDLAMALLGIACDRTQAPPLDVCGVDLHQRALNRLCAVERILLAG